MKKINIVTLGCSKNTVDSENVAGHLKEAGFTIRFDDDKNDADIVIINTCGFIGDAKEESIAAILEYAELKRRKKNPKKIVVCGCLSQRYADELRAEIPEVDAFYGVNDWNKLLGDIMDEYSEKDFTAQRVVSTPKHYAYLKIAEGCNRSCSYCAIPLIRGKFVSRPIDDLVGEAKQLVAQGVKELLVIAQDTTYYGMDIYGKRALAELLERLAVESGAKWIRLHYTFPSSFPDDVIEVMKKYKCICNYIDIPLQHISTDVLASMKRGIDKEGTLQLMQMFRNKLPDVAIRTALIVGYPNETEEDFEQLKDFVRDMRFDRLGVFRYSAEEGTPSFPLGDTVSEEEKQRRMDEIMELQETISIEKNSEKVGKEYMVLIDRREGDFWVGRTEYDSPEIDNEVLISAEEMLVEGRFYKVRIIEAMEYDLMAELCD
ncbi:MAG: 30S ribosomal protein S12 methylthiotransferase RimO [Bacteroidales bacterium]|nr:30S ribosomal protein S12 methylthiotransferase RimO [Bacteroidales bacterium]